MKKLFISFIAMLSVVFFFISGKGYANEVVDNTVTEQQNLEGQVLSHYLKVEEKEGHYTLHFYNKKELKEVLKSFDTELTVEKINEAVAKINDVLAKENGVGPLSDYFKALKNKTLVLVSHVRKGEESENLNDMFLGSSALAQAATKILYLKREKDSNDIISLQMTKTRYTKFQTDKIYLKRDGMRLNATNFIKEDLDI